MDKAGRQFWNDSWASADVPEAVNPLDPGLENYVNRRFHAEFARLFDKSAAPSMRLLEVGCAKSAWLPYFAKEFGFRVSGIDYSPNGCQLARKSLLNSGIEGEVVCADFFSPPAEMLGRFDVVVSFGVVEHFDDTASCLEAISSFLRPGGMLITSIPNMVGWIGSIQKSLNRPVYDIHKLIDPPQLRDAHERAGLQVLECNYFLCTNFGVNNLAGVPSRALTGFLKRWFLKILTRASAFLWLLEGKVGRLPVNRMTSPYINCIARKP